VKRTNTGDGLASLQACPPCSGIRDYHSLSTYIVVARHSALTASKRVLGLGEGHPTFGRQRFTGKRIIVQSDDKDFVMVSYATSIWIRALHDG
jgi:hypothetical protein